MIDFKKNDRLLILAPHPDDETIGTGGVLQTALSQNLPVKVAYFTNGDNNEMSFIVYEKHLVLREKEFIKMGEMRRKEAVAAMKLLGLDTKQLIFLGYPDFGTMHILRQHWGEVPPFRSMLTRVTEVPYPECQSPGAPYCGESILKDLKKVLTDFQPTKIFSPHPADLNVDHRSLFVFLQVALWDLETKISPPQIYPYLVHAAHWPEPKGFFPDQPQQLPEHLLTNDLEQTTFNLTAEMVTKKNEMINCYRSQIEYDPSFLVSFARQTEIFSNYPEITGEIATEHIKSLQFTREQDYLDINLQLHTLLTKERGMIISLFGYRKDTDFSQLPKIQLKLGWRNELLIHEKGNPYPVREAIFQLAEEGKKITIKFPLTALNNPDYVLTAAHTHTRDLPLSASAWRVILL